MNTTFIHSPAPANYYSKSSIFLGHQARYLFYFYLIIIFILAGYSCFANLNGSIEHTDEAMHMTVVQEMWQSGEYFPPKAQGDYYFNKPPLKMILTLPLIKWLGDFNSSYRLIDGFCGLVSLLVIFYLGKLLFDSWTIGFIAVCFLLGNGTLFGPHLFRAAVQDSAAFCLNLLVLIVGIDLIDLGSKKERVSSENRKIFILTGLCAFLVMCSFMIKLVVAFVPISLLAIYALSEQKFITFVKNNKKAICFGLVVFVIIPLAYYLYLHSVYQHIWGYMKRQTFGRLVTEGQHNKDDLFFYFKQLISGKYYGSAIFLATGFTASCWAWYCNRSSKLLFVILWFLFIIIGFSLLRARLEHYLSPAFPAMGLIVGYGIVWLGELLHLKLITAKELGSKKLVTIYSASLVIFLVFIIGLAVDSIYKVNKNVALDGSQTSLQKLVDKIISINNHDRSWEYIAHNFQIHDNRKFLSLKLKEKEDYVYASRLASIIKEQKDIDQIQQLIKAHTPVLLFTSKEFLSDLKNTIGEGDCKQEATIKHKKSTEQIYVVAYNDRSANMSFCK